MDDVASQESSDTAGEDNVFQETDDITFAVAVIVNVNQRKTIFSHGRVTTLLGCRFGDEWSVF